MRLIQKCMFIATLAMIVSSGNAFTWVQRPLLVAFTFEGQINATSVSSLDILSHARNGPWACKTTIAGTWFADLCEPADQSLIANVHNAGHEIAVEGNVVSAIPTDLTCLSNAIKSQVHGLRFSSGLSESAIANSNFSYDSSTFISESIPMSTQKTSSGVAYAELPFMGPTAGDQNWGTSFRAMFCKNYNGARDPVILSVTRMISVLGVNVTSDIIADVMKYTEVVAVTVNQIKNAQSASSVDDAMTSLDLCGGSTPQLTRAPVATTSADNSKATTKPAVTTAAKPDDSSSSNAGNINTGSGSTTNSNSGSTINTNSGSASGTDSVSTADTNSESASHVIDNSADGKESIDGGDSTSASTTIGASASGVDGSIDTGATTGTDPGTTGANTGTDPGTTVTNPITTNPFTYTTITPTVSTTVAPTSSSLSTYLPYALVFVGLCCAFAVFAVYRRFRRREKFPAVINSGYTFDDEDRAIYDIEMSAGSVEPTLDFAGPYVTPGAMAATAEPQEPSISISSLNQSRA